MHPIVAMQQSLLAALAADAGLVLLVGGAIFDAPPRGAVPPYLAIARHDIAPRDGDAAPGHEHRLVIHAWSGEPSRRAVLAMIERVLAVALAADLSAGGLLVTHRQHERTETAIDAETGFARAAVTLRLFSEAG
jgi:hypothetical protein